MFAKLGITNRISDFLKYFIGLNLIFTLPISILTLIILLHYYEDLIQNANENLLIRSKAFSFQLENVIKDRVYPSTSSPEFVKLNRIYKSKTNDRSDLNIVREKGNVYFVFTREKSGFQEEWYFRGEFIIDKILDSNFASPEEIVLLMNQSNYVGVSDSIENDFNITEDMLEDIESKSKTSLFTIIKDRGAGQLVFSNSFPGLPLTLIILRSKHSLYNTIRIQLLNYSLAFLILLFLITAISIYISRSLSLHRKEESKFQSLLQNIPLGACLVDTNLDFIIQNKIWNAILHSDPDLWELIRKEAEFRTRTSTSRANYVWEVSREKIWEVTLSPYYEEQGITDGYTLILRDLSAKKLMFEHEMELARKIQEEYLPSEENNLKGIDFKVVYKPYFQVGGDYYDLIQLDRNRSLFVMADVIGHGMQAAMMMTVIKVLFLQIASTNDNPEDIILQMNQAVKENLPGGKSIVPFHFLILDTDKKTFTYSNAGHPGMVFFPDRKLPTFEVFERMNPVLGLPFAYPSKIEVVQMPYSNHSKFFLYTDGLLDVMNEDDIFGMDNAIEFLLANRLSDPKRFSDNLMERIMEFSEGRDFPDDITWFVIDSN